jgi:hypothetical protein
MKAYSLGLFIISLLISIPVCAHAGHDHSSIFANIIHLLWLAPAFVALAILYSKILKKIYQIKASKQQLKGE